MPKGRSSGKRGGSGGIHLRNISITNNGVITNQEIRKGYVIDDTGDIEQYVRVSENGNVDIVNNQLVANRTIRKGKEVVLSEGNESQIAKQILRKMTLIRYDNFTNELEYKIRKPEQVL